jgi:hypothetical protein
VLKATARLANAGRWGTPEQSRLARGDLVAECVSRELRRWLLTEYTLTNASTAKINAALADLIAGSR